VHCVRWLYEAYAEPVGCGLWLVAQNPEYFSRAGENVELEIPHYDIDMRRNKMQVV